MKVLSGLLWVSIAVLPGLGVPASAETFPSRPVTIVVPFPPGGTADLLPRIIADKLRERWGQTVIVENRPGAAGTTGSTWVANASADGYVLLASPAGPLVINKLVQKAFSFEPLDLSPIAVLAAVPSVLTVRADFPAATVAEFIAYGKANPRKLNYASQGPGSTSHLTAVMFANMTGVEMVHVPYKGSSPALADLMAGNVDLMFDNLGSSLAYHHAGRVRILAIAARQRAAALPDLPTLHESGLAGFDSSTWFALVAPSRTPADVVARINRDVTGILQRQDVRARLTNLGLSPVGDTPDVARDFMVSESRRWAAVVKQAGISPE
jgi:tripartite-type tricarboxylate transporter receptor subunit TctC